MRATRMIWEGAGRPMPVEYDGTPIAPTLDGSQRCAMCGEADARWPYNELFSENFRAVSKLRVLLPHVVEGEAMAFCAACVWCARSHALRASAWIARENGVWFVPRRHLLAVLLDPPEPPFVVGWPEYGADHGGEAHAWRCQWPGAPPLPSYFWPLNEGESGAKLLVPLPRLQAKHVAPYAEVAASRDLYPLQWDDGETVMVDVALWRALASQLAEVAAALRAAGVGIPDTREALAKLRCPMRAPAAVHLRWPALTRGLARHQRAQWWPLLADLLPLPDAPPKPDKPVKAPRPVRATKPPPPVEPARAAVPPPSAPIVRQPSLF